MSDLPHDPNPVTELAQAPVPEDAAFPREPRRRRLVCGVDEAGRGPLAGPVVAAAVVLNARRPIEGVRDSKLLTPLARERLAEAIRGRAVAWAIGVASVEEIERLNILQASLLAMQRAVQALQPAADRALVDGKHLPVIGIPARAIVDGDALEPAISAASILAKTHRDALMRDIDALFPGYGFADNVGYATPEHLQRLRELGPCAVHRRSFAPVRALMMGSLF
jgi:ribonuclease HII